MPELLKRALPRERLASVAGRAKLRPLRRRAAPACSRRVIVAEFQRALSVGGALLVAASNLGPVQLALAGLTVADQGTQ
jgi:hypothetical protein